MNRRRPYRQRTRPNHERWLVSYADFITLLFAFFVVLYASSQGDQKKAARLSGAIEEAFQDLGLGESPQNGPLPPLRALEMRSNEGSLSSLSTREQVGHMSHRMSAEEIQVLNNELERLLASEIKRQDVTIRSAPDGLIISLQELGFFDSGSASLRPSSRDAFARIAAVLEERKCRVRIEGHTDPVPIHTALFDSNWELSTARATGLVKLLIQKYKFEPSNLAAGGYAEFHPVADNDTEEGRRLNRRVDVVIVSAIIASGRASSSPGKAQDAEPAR
jgi:chemotaxis protein MotB